MNTMPVDIPLAYARSARSNGKLLKGQIDNVVSLGVIYVLFQNGYQGTALLSSEEEIGKSWIHITKWLEQNNKDSQNIYVIDTSPYRETDQVNNNMIVLRNRDKSDIFNAKLVSKIKMRCAFLNIPFQVKDEYFMEQGLDVPDLGSTELGRIIQNTKGRWSGATVQIPTIEYHTSYETTSRGCINSFYALLQNILVNDPITV
jgi:putative aminopeptidase FrvX